MTDLTKRLLTTEEAAVYLGMAEQTLINWRNLDKGPKCTPIGRLRRYDIKDLDAWIESLAA